MGAERSVDCDAAPMSELLDDVGPVLFTGRRRISRRGVVTLDSYTQTDGKSLVWELERCIASVERKVAGENVIQRLYYITYEAILDDHDGGDGGQSGSGAVRASVDGPADRVVLPLMQAAA